MIAKLRPWAYIVHSSFNFVQIKKQRIFPLHSAKLQLMSATSFEINLLSFGGQERDSERRDWSLLTQWHKAGGTQGALLSFERVSSLLNICGRLVLRVFPIVFRLCCDVNSICYAQTLFHFSTVMWVRVTKNLKRSVFKFNFFVKRFIILFLIGLGIHLHQPNSCNPCPTSHLS